MAMNGLNKITEKILAQAHEEAARIVSAAEEEGARIRADYQARADQIRETLSAEAQRDATDQIARAKSGAATQKRNALMQTRAELLDEVFEGALQSVLQQNDAQYTDTLIGLLCATLLDQAEAEQVSRELYGEEEAMAPQAYEVILNQRDRDRYGKEVLAGAAKRLGGKLPREFLAKVKLGEPRAAIDGGLILRCGEIESNCTLGLVFAQLRQELESDVSHALFDVKTAF